MKILLDGKELYNSGVIRHSSQKLKEVRISVKGAKNLTLIVEDNGDKGGDHANWADAYFTVINKL